MKQPTKVLAAPDKRRRKPFVVQGGVGDNMWLGGRRHDGGPWWRLWLKDAQRFKTREDAQHAATRSDGTVREKP